MDMASRLRLQGISYGGNEALHSCFVVLVYIICNSFLKPTESKDKEEKAEHKMADCRIRCFDIFRSKSCTAVFVH